MQKIKDDKLCIIQGGNMKIFCKYCGARIEVAQEENGLTTCKDCAIVINDHDDGRDPEEKEVSLNE